MVKFHIINQAQIRQRSYQSDHGKNIVKDLNRDLNQKKIKAFNEKYEFFY
jgi:hypothetical protein